MDELTQYLSITEQQFEILKAIDIASSKGDAKLKAIENHYKNLAGKSIQKPNLFTQLRELEKRDLITRNNGAYGINKIGLRHNVLKHKENVVKQIEKCQIMANDLNTLFRSASENITIRYFSSEEFYGVSSEKLKTTKTYYRISNLPSITAPDASQRYVNFTKDYSYTILNGCRTGALQVRYIISMVPNRMFLRAVEILKNKEAAYKEIEEAYKNLIMLLNIPNLQFRYLDAHIESVGIMESDSSSSCLLPLRISAQRLMGGIMIESDTVCRKYKEMFNNIWNRATPLTKELAKKVAKEKLQQLKKSMTYLIKSHIT